MSRRSSYQSKHADFHAVLAMVPDMAHRVLRREFTTFFKRMTIPAPGWPAIPPQAFVDALADSLVAVGKEGKGLAYVDTLVSELQDRSKKMKNGAVFWPDGSTRLGKAGATPHAPTFFGDACWVEDEISQTGKISRLCFSEDGLTMEGSGLLNDGSRFKFDGNLSLRRDQYEGVVNCVLRETGEDWTADVVLHASSATELEGTWCEPGRWAFSVELARRFD